MKKIKRFCKKVYKAIFLIVFDKRKIIIIKQFKKLLFFQLGRTNDWTLKPDVGHGTQINLNELL